MNFGKLVKVIVPNICSPISRLLPISSGLMAPLLRFMPSQITFSSNKYSIACTPIPQERQLLSPHLVSYCQTAGFKIKYALRRRCKDCYFIKREGRMYVLCRTHPRHKQMEPVKRKRHTWIICSASQSKIRAW